MSRNKGPVALILSRQKLPTLDQTIYPSAANVEKGAYILKDSDGTPDLILIASGSEVSLILEAQEQLSTEGIKARVVSMPSWDLFDYQDQSYRESVLPPHIRKRVAVEAGVTFGWYKYVGLDGDVIGIDSFGDSGEGTAVMKKFGFTVENVVERAKAVLNNSAK